jgi:hypothetical protein
MSTRRPRPLLTSLAALALLLATTAYLAHVHSAAGTKDSDRCCQLCLHWGGGSAGAAPHAAAAPASTSGVLRASLPAGTLDLPQHRPCRAHRSRAPPLPAVI